MLTSAFVYGTLRTGGPNQARFLEGRVLRAAVLPDHRMRDGRYPWIEPAVGATVVGEVVEVDDDLLHRLDDFEGTAVGLYVRTEVRLADGTAAWAWTAGSIAESDDPVVDSGDWLQVDITDGDVTWRFDRPFLTSRWTCIWGRGCQGIRDEPTPERGEGCCSLGADLDGTDEAMLVSARAAMLDPERFQHHAAAADGGVFSDAASSATRVVDGACIFLNRPGFAGGAGCALHIEALASGESPVDWKPSVCWQLPVHVEFEPGPRDTEVATVRAWSRADWGPRGRTMAWCCTEEPEAYVGDRPVVESLAEELEAVVGHEVYVELRRRLRT